MFVNEKTRYNNLLQRYHKAEQYMDINYMTGSLYTADELEQAIQEREKYIPMFIEITKELSRILDTLKSAGIVVSDTEVMGGFEIENVA